MSSPERKRTAIPETPAQVAPSPGPAAASNAPYVEKYWIVRFGPKAHAHDFDNVELTVNGETVICKRETEVCLPDRFLECADHGVHPTFRQLPGETRKITGKVKTFPYDRLREGTRDLFLQTRREGTQITKQNVALYGPDGAPPEQIAQSAG